VTRLLLERSSRLRFTSHTSSVAPERACRVRSVSAGRWIYPRELIEPPAAITVARPLQLWDRGTWDPTERYWGELEDCVPMPLVEVAAHGPRLQ